MYNNSPLAVEKHQHFISSVSAVHITFSTACVQVVHIATGKTQNTFPGDAEPITALAISPNGRHIFAASQSLTSKAWDLVTAKCFRTWKVRRQSHPNVLPCSRDSFELFALE